MMHRRGSPILHAAHIAPGRPDASCETGGLHWSAAGHIVLLNLTHAFGFGLVTASILAIATVALTMQYSVTNVPNFAQGDIMTAGAFGAYTTQFVVNNVIVQAMVAMLVGAAISFFLNWFLLQPF